MDSFDRSRLNINSALICAVRSARKDNPMATKRPSFLKRQKEQKRNARAQEKREARRGRKEGREAEIPGAFPQPMPIGEADENAEVNA